MLTSAQLHLVVLLIGLFSQLSPAALLADRRRPPELALNTDLERSLQRRVFVQGSPTPRPPALEAADFIHRRQYADRYPPENLLPDLRSLLPADFKIVLDLSQDRRTLHFSTAFWNRGPGVLELLGREMEGRLLLEVTQQVYRSDGSVMEKPAGFFEYEGAHGHWHWENFSRYELWMVSEKGLDRLVATNDKVGFCLRDVSVYDRNPDHIRLPSVQSEVAQLAYDSCFWEKQGLSVGWTDIYRANIPGQFVEITGLPDGLYALRTTIDPDNIILETDESNNSVVRYVLVEGTLVTAMPADFSPVFLTVDFD